MLLAVTLSFAGPSCLPGQAPADAEHCCWPGQRWDGACQGTPTCPAGTVADGASCRSATRIVSAVEARTGQGVVELAASGTGGGPWTGAAGTPADGVDLAHPVVVGAVDDAAVWTALAGHTSAIRGCSLTEGATATLRIVSDATGAVTTATAKDARPAAFGTCLADAARTWRLPPSGGGIVVVSVPVQVAGR